MTKSTLWIFFAFICFSILGMGVFMPKVGNWDFISAKYGKSTVSAKFNKLMTTNFFVRNAAADTTYMPEAMLMKGNLFADNATGNTTNNAIMFFMIVGVMGLLVGINRKKQLAAVKENDAFENGEKPLSIGRLDVAFSYAVEVKNSVREDNLQEVFEQMTPIYYKTKVAEKTELVYQTVK